MTDLQRIFHTGVLVPDVDAAMAEIGPSMGLTWATVQHSIDRAVWTPTGGLENVELTFVYSCEGPQHVELLHGGAGSVWDPGDRPGLHHVGVWSDDVAADAGRLVSRGWRVAAAGRAPADGFGSFAYLVPPSGLIVELVASSTTARFEAWWAGGPMGSERV